MLQTKEKSSTTFAIPDVSAPVYPWGYNPSAWAQRIPLCILATIAAAIAGYMALYQWRLIPFAWDPIFGGQTMAVLDSDVSERMRVWFLVPDASFGALAYLGDAIFGMAGSTRRWQCRPWLVIIFGFDVIPLGVVSVILVILQGTVVQSWCFLCLVTAVISVILIYWAADEVWSCLVYLYRVWRDTRSASIFWKALWGWPTPEAHQVALQMMEGK